VYFEGFADHDIIICDEKGLGLKGTGNMLEDSLAKSLKLMFRMTPKTFNGHFAVSFEVCPHGQGGGV